MIVVSKTRPIGFPVLIVDAASIQVGKVGSERQKEQWVYVSGADMVNDETVGDCYYVNERTLPNPCLSS